MRIGIFARNVMHSGGSIEALVTSAQEAEEQGFSTFWLSQIFGGIDSLTALAVIGRLVTRIELGASIVPTYSRHPTVLVGQAAVAQSASDNRLVLGIGPSHQSIIEGNYGYRFEKPVVYVREYLTIIRQLLAGGEVAFVGEFVSCRGRLNVADTHPYPVLLSALGPQMLKLAGSLADGTITWMTGPITLKDHTVPTITAAARAAGRTEPPRVVVGLPICVTDDPDAAKDRALVEFGMYGGLPSYRKMLDREGATGPVDVAMIGTEKSVRAAIQELADAGATDFMAAEFWSSGTDRDRTRALLQELTQT